MKKVRLPTVSMYADNRFHEIRAILETMARLGYPGLGKPSYLEGHEIPKITLLKSELPPIRELIENLGYDFGFLGNTRREKSFDPELDEDPFEACSSDGETSISAKTPEEALSGLWIRLREYEIASGEGEETEQE